MNQPAPDSLGEFFRFEVINDAGQVLTGFLPIIDGKIYIGLNEYMEKEVFIKAMKEFNDEHTGREH